MSNSGMSGAERTRLAAAIFDVDGVLVASPHGHLAGSTRRLRRPLPGSPPSSTSRASPASRGSTGGIATLEGLGVPGAAARAADYARKKQALIDQLIAEGGFEAFPDADRCRCLRRGRLAVGAGVLVEERRRHAAPPQAGRWAPVDVDLRCRPGAAPDVPRGKPDPALFLLAAKALDVPPAHSLVVEDAPSGIAAARAGGMASVGIARLGDEALLRAVGADLVVTRSMRSMRPPSPKVYCASGGGQRGRYPLVHEGWRRGGTKAEPPDFAPLIVAATVLLPQAIVAVISFWKRRGADPARH